MALACAPGARTPASPTPTEGFVASADGVSIAYRSSGAGEVALVFLHCWSCDQTYWDDAFAHEAPRHRVVSLDYAGHGRSGRGRKEWSVSSFAADVSAVVRKLALTRVVLIAHSMSGPIAVEVARELQGTVVAIIGVDTLANLSDAPKPERADAFGASLAADFPTMTGKVVKSLFPKDASGPVFDRVTHDMASADPSIAIPTIVANWKYPSNETLRTLHLPMRAIQAEATKTDVAANRAVVPDYDVIMVPGVGHWLMLEAPQTFDDALDRSLASLKID